jgi:hypothetical protein
MGVGRQHPPASSTPPSACFVGTDKAKLCRCRRFQALSVVPGRLSVVLWQLSAVLGRLSVVFERPSGRGSRFSARFRPGFDRNRDQNK